MGFQQVEVCYPCRSCALGWQGWLGVMPLDQEWFLLGVQAPSSIAEGCPWRWMGVRAGGGVSQTGGWTCVAHWLWIATLGGVLWPDIDFPGGQWQAKFKRGGSINICTYKP